MTLAPLHGKTGIHTVVRDTIGYGWMQRFSDIFHAQTTDGESKARTLDQMAQAAGWTVLHPGDKIHLEEGLDSIVITGVTWSIPDLEALDELAAREAGKVWFFNLDGVFPDGGIWPSCHV